MGHEVSVILPTTGRPGRAEQCVRRLLETLDGIDAEVICVVDLDEDTKARLEALGEPVRVLYSDAGYRGKSKAWNDGLAASDGAYIVSAADDVWFGDGWYEAALDAMATLPDGGGLVGFNDTHTQKPTHWMATRWWIVNGMGGVMAWEFYPTSHNDVETYIRAARAGRYMWAQNAVVRHDHFIFGSRGFDETDVRWMRLWQEARDVFERRERQGFPDDFEPAITE